MNKYFIIIQFIIVITVFTNAYAGVKTLVLENVIDLTLKNNTDIQLAEKNVRVAKFQYYQSLDDLFMPQATLSGGLSAPNQASNLTAASDYPVYSASLTVNKTIFDGFKEKNAADIQNMNLYLVILKERDKKEEIKLSAITSFYNTLLLSEIVKASEASDDNLRENFNFTEEKYRRGNAALLDYIQAKLSYKSNQPKLIKARQDYAQAKINLCSLIGITNYYDVEFAGDLYSVTNLSYSGISFQSAIDKAVSNSIEIGTIKYNLASAKINRSTKEFSMLPALSASFNYQYNYQPSNGSSLNQKASWETGVQMSVSIDSLVPYSKTFNSISEADENIRILELSQKQAENNIAIQVNELIMNIQKLKETMESQKENLDLAKLSRDMTEARYRLGQASMLDNNTAQSGYQQAVSDYLQSVYDYYGNFMKLKRMIGDDL